MRGHLFCNKREIKNMTDFATPEEIEYSEKVLFGKDGVFDEDRKNIIKANGTCDIKACPGSGKTTTLLAKLIVLSNKMPLESGRGICVLTHTNVAINEIRRKLGAKASSLFSYPNFFGTIQTFVDTFLAGAALQHYYGTSIKIIDKNRAGAALLSEYHTQIKPCQGLDAYLFRQIENRYTDITNEFDTKTLDAFAKLKIASKNKKGHYNLDCSQVKKKSLDGSALSFELKRKLYEKKKHVNCFTNKDKDLFICNSYVNFVDNVIFCFPGRTFKCNTTSGKQYLQIKESVFKEGILSFKDAYYLGLRYLNDFPQLKEAISSRFNYLFMDEMQDTSSLQSHFIEQAFDSHITIIQKFGDPNQAIYDSINYKENKKAWNPCDFLPINQSLRFGESIANVLRTICVEDNSKLVGNDDISSLKPLIILFDNPRDVLPTFRQIIEGKKVNNKSILSIAKEESLKKGGTYQIKAVGWVKESDNPANLTITTYFPQFNSGSPSFQRSYNCFMDFMPTGNFVIADVTTSINDALLRLLKIAGIKTTLDRDYTRTSFFNKLEEENQLDDYKTNLAIWCSKAINDKITSILPLVKDWVKTKLMVMLQIPEKTMNDFFVDSQENRLGIQDSPKNIYDEDIEVSTIHGVKGETHVATLYLETSYEGKCESQWIEEQIKGVPFTGRKGDTYVKQALKMAYVGMSRPKYLLCFAIRKGHLSDETLNSQEFNDRWEVVKV